MLLSNISTMIFSKIYVFITIGMLCVQRMCTQVTGSVNVNTPYGGIQGLYEQDGPVRINRFLGIPYAKAPLNNLRFEPPERHDGWDQTYEAIAFRPPCLQLSNNSPMGSENCLYLNIYVPGNITVRQQTPIPVMVYIHGGEFMSGSGSDYNGDRLINPDSDSSVIVVTLNYRLGIFGFLCSGDNNVPGNMGLKDQAFAIKWIHDNIAYFGGDSTKITIFGQEYGGLSVKLHVFSPMNAETFHRAIIQSGLQAWKFVDKSYHRENFINFAEEVSCYGDSTGLLRCLQSKNAVDLLGTTRVSLFQIPVIDGQFLHLNPEDSLNSGNFNKVDLIVGFNTDDESMGLSKDPSQFDLFISNGIPARSTDLIMAFGYCVHATLSPFNNEYDQDLSYLITNTQALLEAARTEYIPNDVDPFYNGRRFLDVLRDCVFVTHSLQMAEVFPMHGLKAYVYYFNHRSSSLSPNLPNTVPQGAPLGGELPYVFGDAISEPEFTDSEVKMSQAMINAWTTFATSGMPYYHDLGYNSHIWPSYGAHMRNILVLDQDSLSTAGNPIQQGNNTWLPVLQFWMSVRDTAVYRTSTSTTTTESTVTSRLESSTVTTESAQDTDVTSTESIPEIGSQQDNSKKLHTEYLNLDGSEADIAIFMLAAFALFLLLICIALACNVFCCERRSHAHKRAESNAYAE